MFKCSAVRLSPEPPRPKDSDKCRTSAGLAPSGRSCHQQPSRTAGFIEATRTSNNTLSSTSFDKITTGPWCDSLLPPWHTVCGPLLHIPLRKRSPSHPTSHIWRHTWATAGKVKQDCNRIQSRERLLHSFSSICQALRRPSSTSRYFHPSSTCILRTWSPSAM